MNGPEFHCPFAMCNQIDFLPYECKFCGIKFCSAHRTPESHNCLKADKNKENSKVIPKTQRKCAKDDCKTKLSPVNEFECKKCGKMLCLKHRYEESHDCGKPSSSTQRNGNIEKAEKKEKKEKSSGFSCFWVCCKPKKKLSKI